MRDKSRPHQFPTAAIGEEVIGWRCQACGTWIREFGRYEPGDCPINWRAGPNPMTRLLALWERHYARVTKRRNATHHRPAPTTRKARP